MGITKNASRPGCLLGEIAEVLARIDWPAALAILDDLERPVCASGGQPLTAYDPLDMAAGLLSVVEHADRSQQAVERVEALPDDPGAGSNSRATKNRARMQVANRFGNPGSIPVTVVLDEVGPEGADLYVDGDRNRKIGDCDRVNGTAITESNTRREHTCRYPPACYEGKCRCGQGQFWCR